MTFTGAIGCFPTRTSSSRTWIVSPEPISSVSTVIVPIETPAGSISVPLSGTAAVRGLTLSGVSGTPRPASMVVSSEIE